MRERKVDETVDKLKEKHGNSFTQMQYCIWSEMIVGNVHSSIDLPPNTSMFTRAGASGGVQRKKPDSGFAESLTDFVKQLSGGLSPTSIATVLHQVQAPQNQLKVIPSVTKG